MTTPRTMADQAAAIADRSTTPNALVAEALERARASTAVLISRRDNEALVEAAEATDRWRRGEPLSPFDGVPVVVKDLFDLTGTITSAGSATMNDTPAATVDAAVIDNLKAAGCVIIGKTNLSEFAFSGIGTNAAFGNPTPLGRDDRVPGGSSSGTAIAIQRGIVAGGLGTDTAGSVRIPAAFNGLVGFRPSMGRYPMRGVFPLAVSFDTIGPITTTVADCALLDMLMRGERRAVVTATALPEFVVEPRSLTDSALTSDVLANTERCIERLRSAGATVVERPLPSLGRARAAIAELGWLGGVEAAALHRDRLMSDARQLMDPVVVARLDASSAMPTETVERLRTLQRELLGDIATELGDAILIGATAPMGAPEAAPLLADLDLFLATNRRALSLTMPLSFLQLPGIAMPSGIDGDGQPTSVLFSSRPGTDDVLLGTALLTEHLLAP